MAEIRCTVSEHFSESTISSKPIISNDIIPCSTELEDITPEKLQERPSEALCSETILNVKDRIEKDKCLHNAPHVLNISDVYPSDKAGLQITCVNHQTDQVLTSKPTEDIITPTERYIQRRHPDTLQIQRQPVCCSPYHHATVEDTFAAYCHPQSIPAPAQVLPRLLNTDRDCKRQNAGPTLLSLPPLVSSISETRLDSKKTVHCCSLDYKWPGVFFQARAQPQTEREVRKLKDAGTMTSYSELRDIAIQVGQDLQEKSPQYVLPTVCLVEERENGNDKLTGQKKTPVKDVKWDSEGMTWEVYGASVDPEELGLAIQKHLEIQIKETTGRQHQSWESRTTSKLGNEKKKSKRSKSVMISLRPSVCCSRNSTAVD